MSALSPAAARRLAQHEPMLRSRLESLYGRGPAQDHWFASLMAQVGELHGARSPELLELDERRAADPRWFVSQHMLGYSAYAGQFGAGLLGVTQRIAHLQELGVTYLHLLPFLRPRAGENDGGFAVASFDQVDPALGTEADLLALTAALRTAGISLCADLVLNHVADDHPWASGAAAGDAALRDYFHVFSDRTAPDRYEASLGQVFPQAAPGNFTWSPAMQGWVWTTFYPFQWDLNYANPAVLAEMITAMLRLANRGVEVFRLDSTAFLWKRAGTSCMNQPEAHTLLQIMRAIVDIAAPGVLLKAEAIVPTRELPAYFGAGDARECHLAYHSTLMAAGWAALAEQDTALLQQVIAATPALPPAACWLTYVRCHDDIGWNVLRDEAGSDDRLARIAGHYNSSGGVAFQSGPGRAVHGTNGTAASLAVIGKPGGAHRVLLLHALALSFGALPVLYMGDELAMENDDAYLNDPLRAHDTRWVQRAAFDQARHALRLQPASAAGSVYRGLLELIARRRAIDALAADAPRTLLATQHRALLALARGEHFLALFNFSGLPLTLSLDGMGSWSGEVQLAPWSHRWLERAAP